jgi:enoyl-[acyl-carrier-protein] reductase (NADH)
MLEIAKVYPLDAVFDTPEDVPDDVKNNKRYAGSSKWTVQEVAEAVKADYGSIDILVHSLANGPEVTKPLLETSRGIFSSNFGIQLLLCITSEIFFTNHEPWWCVTLTYIFGI